MEIVDGKKKILKKKIVLKNGQPAKLEFYRLPDIFSIYGIDKNNEVAGQLSFEIMQKFVHALTEEERAKEAFVRKIPLSMVKKDLQIDVFQSSSHLFDINDNVLTLYGEEYKLKKTSAILNLIEIKNKNFFQVGLGSAMHKEMESYARKIKCDEIRLSLYYPFGEFQSGTRPFYEHMGYTFENKNGTTCVYKPLTPENDMKVANNTSLDAPLNKKNIAEKEK